MSQTTVLTLLQQTLWTVVQIGGPILMAALIVGLLISLIQAVTQINEMTLSYVPKVIVIGLVLVFAGPWMLQTLISFAAQIFNSLPQLVQ